MTTKSSKKSKQYLHGRNNIEVHLGDCNAIICKIPHPMLNRSEITVSMVIRKEYQDNPPQPFSSEIFVEEQHKRLIYAKKLPKLVTEDGWYEAYCEMKDLLNHNDNIYLGGIYYRITFINKIGRKIFNELWVIGEAVNHDYVCLQNDEESNEEL